MANKKEINPKTGVRLQELIKNLKMTQVEFGERIGLGAQQISCIVRGERRLTEDNARRIAELFPPIRMEWLMGWDDYVTDTELGMSKLYDEIERRNQRSFDMDRKTECVQDILDVMAYHIGKPSGGVREAYESMREDKFLGEFIGILDKENNILKRFLGDSTWFQIKTLVEKELVVEDEKSIKESGIYTTEIDDYRKKCLENPDEYIESYTKKVQQFDNEKLQHEYAIYDKNWNIVACLSGVEMEDFVNEIHDAVAALIQYHITKGKKKGQA